MLPDFPVCLLVFFLEDWLVPKDPPQARGHWVQLKSKGSEWGRTCKAGLAGGSPPQVQEECEGPVQDAYNFINDHIMAPQKCRHFVQNYCSKDENNTKK